MPKAIERGVECTNFRSSVLSRPLQIFTDNIKPGYNEKQLFNINFDGILAGTGIGETTLTLCNIFEERLEMNTESYYLKL